MKNLLGIKSLVIEVSGNPQSVANNVAMLAKCDAAKGYRQLQRS